MTAFSEEQMNELKETFTAFDNDGDGSIKTKDIGLVFKYLNQIVGEDEIQEMALEVDPDGSGQFDFPSFVTLMTKRIKDDDTYEELLESFKVFDSEGTGLISIADLRFILSQLGDKMTPEEIEEIVKDVDDGQGQMKYDPYIKEKLEKLKK